ncbi:MAG: polymer-forming cytoskeletal protein [Pseudomonadota bacterium]
MQSARARMRLTFSCIALAMVSSAGATEGADNPVIADPIAGDAYAAHSQVTLRASVDGDFVAAGRRVTIDSRVAGDVIAAAQDIEILTAVGDDLRLAGQHIRVAAPVAGHIVAAGQSVRITGDVEDWAWLAGEQVDVLGRVGADLKIRATTVTIDGVVTGDVNVTGDTLVLGPNAQVGGNVTWRSQNAAVVSNTARIEGELIHTTEPAPIRAMRMIGGYQLPMNTIVAVAVLFLLFTTPMRNSADRLARRPFVSLFLGVAVIVGTPALVFLLFSTGIASWLALAVLFSFLTVVLLGILTGLFAVSDIVLRKVRKHPPTWQALIAIVLAVVLIQLLMKLPKIGIGFGVVVMLVGVGALCGNAVAALRSTLAPPPDAQQTSA